MTSPQIPLRSLGIQGLRVPSIGLGCMGMSAFYSGSNPVSEDDCIATIHHAIDNGCNFLDTSDIYGPFTNEVLVGRAIKKYPREKIILATKFGIVFKDENFSYDASKKHVREACEASLSRLGVDYIDLYYLHRKDPATPIEETMQALKELVAEGKVRYIGVSETSPQDIRRGHAIHPISAVQLEWSLWSRDAEAEVIPTCRQLGIGIVAYSPLGRGFLTGQIKSPDDLDDSDYRKTQPRFKEEAFRKNMAFLEKVQALVAKKGCTPGQLALAWVLAQGEDVVAIPWMRRIKYLEENLGAAQVQVGEQELQELHKALDDLQVAGERYDDMKSMSFHYDK